MNNEDQTQNIAIALGALSETAWIFYSNCVSQGFTSSQAFELTCVWIQNTLSGGKNE